MQWTPELVAEYPDSLIIPFYPRITNFDVFANAEENYERLLEDVRSGKTGTLEELALPAGGDYSAMLMEKRAPEEKREELPHGKVVRVQS